MRIVATISLAVAFCFGSGTAQATALNWGTIDGTGAVPKAAGGTAFWQSVIGQGGTYQFTFKKPVKFFQASCFLDGYGFDASSCVVSIIRDPTKNRVQVRTYYLDQFVGPQGDIHTVLGQTPGKAFVSIAADQ